MHKDVRVMPVENLIWDSHCCVPLRLETRLSDLLKRHYKAGVRFVSINVGMDMIPQSNIFNIINHFTAEILATEYLILVNSIEELSNAYKSNKLAIAFDLEGGLAFSKSEHMVELFSSLGVRQVSLAYNRSNELAGGCFDYNSGLTIDGKRILDSMKKQGMIIDCSHISYKSSIEIMEYIDSPVIFSHSNPFSLVGVARNIMDDQIKKCAEINGVICISGLSWLLNEEKPTIDSYVRHIMYVADLVGVNYVGLGLDFVYDDHIDDIPKDVEMDYWWPELSASNRKFKCSFLEPDKINLIVEKLSKYFSKKEVSQIIGGNMFNLASKVWV